MHNLTYLNLLKFLLSVLLQFSIYTGLSEVMKEFRWNSCFPKRSKALL